jgi:hypothetical protein
LLFRNRFQLGDRFQILGPSSRALRPDELVESEAAARDAEHFDRHASLNEIVVCPTTDDLA